MNVSHSHDLGSGADIDFDLAAVPEVGGNAGHSMPDRVIEAKVIAVLVQSPLEEDDANETGERTQCQIHAIAIRKLLSEDELADHEESGEKDGKHGAQQVPRCHLLEEQTDGQTKPAYGIVRCGRFKVSKEEEHALNVQDGVDVIQTMPRSRIHAQKLRCISIGVSIGYNSPSHILLAGSVCIDVNQEDGMVRRVAHPKKRALRTRRGIFPCITRVISNRSDQTHERDDEDEALLPSVGVKDGRKKRQICGGRNGDLKTSIPSHVDCIDSRC